MYSVGLRHLGQGPEAAIFVHQVPDRTSPAHPIKKPGIRRGYIIEETHAFLVVVLFGCPHTPATHKVATILPFLLDFLLSD
jgi:hypothetical protein